LKKLQDFQLVILNDLISNVIAPLLAEAIRRVQTKESVSNLFASQPPRLEK